jgi:2-keto-myo-inositol isomerase
MFGMDGLGASYEIPYTGLVHISGVEDDIPADQFLDAHRVLVGPKDRMENKEIIQRFAAAGYSGTFSFEPFGGAVQQMPPDKLSLAIQESLRFLDCV